MPIYPSNAPEYEVEPQRRQASQRPNENVSLKVERDGNIVIPVVYLGGQDREPPRRDRDRDEEESWSRPLQISRSSLAADTPLTVLGTVRRNGVYMISGELSVTAIDLGAPSMLLSVQFSPLFSFGASPQTASQSLAAVGSVPIAVSYAYLPAGSQISYSAISGWTYVAAQYGFNINVVKVA